MPPIQEDDFPKGHPARFDYDPSSPEAIEWARINIHPAGARDFPVGHPKAVDTPGSTNHLSWAPGVDPLKPTLEPFTGRTPEQAAAHRAFYQREAARVTPTPPRPVVEAPANPPAPTVRRVLPVAGKEAFQFTCPGCGLQHVLDKQWAFNGSLELPTFSPAYRLRDSDGNLLCHCQITNGTVFFLPDSPHKYVGQTMELPSILEG